MKKLLSLILLCGFASHSTTAALTDTITVDVIKPVQESQQNRLQLTGSIEAIQDTDLAVQQSGVVEAIFVDQGDYVKQGDKLLQLDATIANYRLNELKALLSVIKIEYDEANRLYKEVLALSKTQVVAQTLIAQRQADVARAKSRHIQQQAAVDLQTEVLKRFTLYAPFDGVIAQRNSDVGEWVTPQQWVFNLVSNKGLRLRIALPQEYFSIFRREPGMATIMPDYQDATELQLPVSNIVAVSNPATRTVTALIELPQSQQLIAGMSARVSLDIGGNGQDFLWLPQSAIKSHPDGGSSVFAVQNGKAKRFVVQLGKQQGDKVAVMGAMPQLNYVVKGVEILQDGQWVTVNTSGNQ